LTYIVDIDDTLILYSDSNRPYWERGAQERYKTGFPNIDEIKKLNKLYENNIIILMTGRGWHRMKFTETQLEMFGVKYHRLIMGKPPGIIVDRDSLKELP
jgi:hypothetical protein